MKRPLGVTIFGTINIMLGIYPSIFLIQLFLTSASFINVILLFTFAGWVTDNEFKDFMDWFLLTIMERGFLIIIYIFSLLLLWSGLAMLKKKAYSRKLSIISISVIVLSWIGFSSSGMIHANLYHNVPFNFNSLEIGISFGLLSYAILLIQYLNQSAIKVKFDGGGEQFSITKLMLLTLAILIFLIFGYLIIPWGLNLCKITGR
jgi:hypothetical protein